MLVLDPDDVRRACLEARHVHRCKEIQALATGPQFLSVPIRLRCVVVDNDGDVEIRCNCDDDDGGTQESQKDCCTSSCPSRASLTSVTHRWLGSIGAGVRARCGGLERPGSSKKTQLGGWGEARRQRRWPGSGTGEETTLRVEAYVVVNSFGDVIPNAKGGCEGSSKDAQLICPTAALLRECGRSGRSEDGLDEEIPPHVVAVFVSVPCHLFQDGVGNG